MYTSYPQLHIHIQICHLYYWKYLWWFILCLYLVWQPDRLRIVYSSRMLMNLLTILFSICLGWTWNIKASQGLLICTVYLQRVIIFAGIAVSNVPGYGVEEVADSTMSLILNLYRRTFWLANMVRDGKKITGPESLREAATGSARIRGDTLGIVGLGQSTFDRTCLHLIVVLC